MAVMSDLVNRSIDPTMIDVVAGVRSALDLRRRNVEKTISAQRIGLKKLEAMTGRFGAASLLERIRAGEADRLKAYGRCLQDELAEIDRAEALLADETYRFQPPPLRGGWSGRRSAPR